MDEIKLCKCKCGNKKPKLDFVLSVDPPKKVRSKTWQIVCKTCGISGPKKDTNSGAIDGWNNLVMDIVCTSE